VALLERLSAFFLASVNEKAASRLTPGAAFEKS
jgi:hypothetical protein